MELGRFGCITVTRRNFSANLKSVCQLSNSLVFWNTADSALASIRMTQSAEGCRIVDGPNFNSVRPTLILKYPELVGYAYCQLSLVFYICLYIKQLLSQCCASTIKVSKLVHHVRIVNTLTLLQLVKFQC